MVFGLTMGLIKGATVLAEFDDDCRGESIKGEKLEREGNRAMKRRKEDDVRHDRGASQGLAYAMLRASVE